MVVCYLCKEEFKDNSGGQLTNHLLGEHKVSKADYHVITKLNGVEPKCDCGYCDDRPSFYRNVFKKYASGHDNPKFKEEQYIKKFGNPLCKTCGCPVRFHRGVPNTYCSPTCLPSNWNQDKVKKTIKEKYNVDNVMEVEEFKNKVRIFNKGLWGNNYEDQLNKFKKISLDKYGVEFPSQSEVVKERQRETMMRNYGVSHYSKTDKFRHESSNRMLINNPMKDPITVLKCITTSSKNNKWNSVCKQYKSTDLHYQSSYEYDFLELCEKLNVLNLIKKPPSFKYLNKKSYHFPDYLFNDELIIEIKSTWILNIQGGIELINEKRKSVEGKNYKYLLILNKEYTQFEKLIEEYIESNKLI